MSGPIQLPKPNKWTEEERAALSKKLDDELEQFMEEIAARKVNDKEEKKPFDFDEWCKQIDEHPAFMKELKTNNGKYHETIEALQAMKYDKEDDEDKTMTAEHNKKEGNKHFQYKKYRWAIDCYTNGIKEKSTDKKLNAILYFNRAAANRHLGNLRTAIKDCTMGRRFDPTHLKGMIRGAECILQLEYARDAINWIESSKKLFAFEKETSDNPNLTNDEKKYIDELEQLRLKAVEMSLKEERNKRKLRAEEKKETEAKKKILDALKQRNLNLSPRLPFDRPDLMDWARITVSLPWMKTHERVKFDDDGNLAWPILLQYPEVGQVDVLTDTSENTFIGELLKEVLLTPAEWDPDHKYKFENVKFFVSDEYEEYLMEVFEWNNFETILKLPNFQIKQGLPVIIILTRKHAEETLKQINEGENRYVVKEIKN